ncbi:DUF2207 domain-containing protein [Bifidobacterium pseudocatenulatum]|uniref:DUF2207 domain-containing protein n=1 Tax=Bifidobacterium pseudocatenulatum TaxID=28026 RepID=UPI000F756DC4|nr:DUF2207 domain-containing protein [Bifidobacterium pseudocatenulatum]AZN74229.1 DUF2207 domain-containing protein [Bifidobacterium pseudocatenulatum]
MAAKQYASRGVRSVFIAIAATIGVVAIMLLAIALDDGSADLSYKTLDYDVQVQSNGDLKVTQHIDMKLADRSDDDGDHPWKQLYQQYMLKESDLTNITDISVRNVTTGETYQQGDIAIPSSYSTGEWNQEHAKQWYIADVSQGDSNPQPFDPAKDGLVAGNTDDRSKKIEIGWNIPVTTSASSMKFDITMTMQGVTTAYQDVATFQWEPFGANNQIPIGKVTGTITFPNDITADNSWAWLHTERTSTTERGDKGSLQFTVHDVRAGDYVDVVAMFDVDATSGVARTRDTTIKNGIMKSEARQERQWRDQQRKKARIRLITWIAIAVIGLVLCVIAVALALRSFNRSQYHGDIEYWRDEPEMSPASAAELLHMVADKHSKTLSSRKMSASVLSLASRGAIAIYPGVAAMYQGIDMSQANNADIARLIANDPARTRDVGKTSTVVILPVVFDNVQSLRLCPSEQAALDLLVTASERIGSPVFDLDQMNENFSDWENGYKLQEKFTNTCDNEFAMLGATSICGGGAFAAGICAVMLAFLSMLYFGAIGNLALLAVISVPMMFASVFALSYLKLKGLTDNGQYLAGQVVGLKRYMEDFSDFRDRGVADLTLWGRYMVYATAFGISEKAMKQLLKAYPQLADPNWLDANASDSLLYWSYRSWYFNHHYAGPASCDTNSMDFSPSANFGDIGAQLESGFADIQSTIAAASPSSSYSGSGGSFSGGGFGGSSGGSGGGSFGGR